MAKARVTVGFREAVDSARWNLSTQDYIRQGQIFCSSFGSVVTMPDNVSKAAHSLSTDTRPRATITLAVWPYNPAKSLWDTMRLDYETDSRTGLWELQYNIGSGFVRVTDDGASAATLLLCQTNANGLTESGHDIVDLSGVAAATHIEVRLQYPAFTEEDFAAWAVTGVLYSANVNMGVEGIPNGSSDSPF